MTTAHRASRGAWVGPATDVSDSAARILSDLPGLPPALAFVLAGRGITDPSALRTFLRPRLDQLHDPGLLPDMEAALARLEAALDAGETALVHGDFDADGMCATALAVRGLRRLGLHAVPFVPHRRDDGYDLRTTGVRRALDAGASLILTVDCGVTAVEAVEEASRHGIDVIVTDHHRPGPRLPGAVAVVDPAREGSGYPFGGLAGVGIAFKLIAALFERRGVPEVERNQHLDLAAIGTVADRMPLVDENRTIVRAGLRALERTRKAGLRALLRRLEIGHPVPVSAEDVAFRIAPRLNSVGRMAAAATGVRLLLTDDPREADRLVAELDALNELRRTTDRELTERVERQVAERLDLDGERAIVAWGDGWHRGVVGIVASRLVDRFDRPAVVVSFEGEVGEGSARSIRGFQIHDALRECGDLLDGFGGHGMAAGLRIRRDRIEAFAERLRDLAAAAAPPADRPSLRIDLELGLDEIDDGLADALAHLAPHGEANPVPVLAVRGVTLGDVACVGPDGAHLRVALTSGSRTLRGIGFGLGPRARECLAGDRFDVAFELERDVWQGRRRLQARVLDLAPTAR